MNVQFLSPRFSHRKDVDVEMLDGNSDEEQELVTPNLSQSMTLVTPGQLITSDTQFMRGHGTYIAPPERMTSSVAGAVERVNKLISVRPLHTRYTGEIGDLVIGRITEVSQRRWKVDVNSRQDGVLQLSSINLPGGVQRRKTEEDELQIRKFFAEGDLLVAEVHAFFQDGATNLHTRNSKYGKLRNGSFISVPPPLVQRCKTHFHTLSCGIDVTLGLNGYIWVSKHITQSGEEIDPDAIYSNQNELIDDSTREKIARVCNSIHALSQQFMYINDTIISYAYEASLEYHVRDLRKPDIIDAICMEVSAKISLGKAGVL
ncbi:hypothetical protein G9A89_023844 [Geosiphon pyriformis]|nr:hypothetical protein G9A89_023844 [Geosiphon pyriformis]